MLPHYFEVAEGTARLSTNSMTSIPHIKKRSSKNLYLDTRNKNLEHTWNKWMMICMQKYSLQCVILARNPTRWNTMGVGRIGAPNRGNNMGFVGTWCVPPFSMVTRGVETSTCLSCSITRCCNLYLLFGQGFYATLLLVDLCYLLEPSFVLKLSGRPTVAASKKSEETCCTCGRRHSISFLKVYNEFNQKLICL